MRSIGDVAVKVTLNSAGAKFVEFTTWLSDAIAEHYGGTLSPAVEQAFQTLKSR